MAVLVMMDFSRLSFNRIRQFYRTRAEKKALLAAQRTEAQPEEFTPEPSSTAITEEPPQSIPDPESAAEPEEKLS
jgi:hypothetical protein